MPYVGAEEARLPRYNRDLNRDYMDLMQRGSDARIQGIQQEGQRQAESMRTRGDIMSQVPGQAFAGYEAGTEESRRGAQEGRQQAEEVRRGTQEERAAEGFDTQQQAAKQQMELAASQEKRAQAEEGRAGQRFGPELAGLEQQQRAGERREKFGARIVDPLSGMSAEESIYQTPIAQERRAGETHTSSQLASEQALRRGEIMMGPEQRLAEAQARQSEIAMKEAEAEDAWNNARDPQTGQTNFQAGKQLTQDQLQANLKATEASTATSYMNADNTRMTLQMALNEFHQGQEDRAIARATTLFASELQNPKGNPQALQHILRQSGIDESAIAQAMAQGQQQAQSTMSARDMTVDSSPMGMVANHTYSDLNAKAAKLGTLRNKLSEYKKSGYNTPSEQRLRAEILPLLDGQDREDFEQGLKFSFSTEPVSTSSRTLEKIVQSKASDLALQKQQADAVHGNLQSKSINNLRSGVDSLLQQQATMVEQPLDLRSAGGQQDPFAPPPGAGAAPAMAAGAMAGAPSRFRNVAARPNK